MQQQQPQVVYVHKSGKSTGTALVLEVIFGMFGILGIGWLYSGNVLLGLLLLFGFIVWDIINVVIIVFSAGIGAFCTLPIGLGIIALSAVLLAGYTSGHKDFS